MAEILNDDTISPTGCIAFANRLIQLCGLSFPKITSIQNINSKLLVSLFEHITGSGVPDLLLSSDSFTEAHNIQALIDTLSLDILGISLSHITGEHIVSGNILDILCLLELLEAVFLHLHTQNKKDLKDSSEEELENDPLAVSPTEEENRRKIESLNCLSSSSDEYIPAARVLKRKTCKNTLRKYHENPHIPQKSMLETSQTESAESSLSKRHLNSVDGCKSAPKRKSSKPPSSTIKQPHTEVGIEQFYQLNLELKVRTLLHSDKSTSLRAWQMKKQYVQSLKGPLKKTHIATCKKSFLLPHNLRPKNKSSVQHCPTLKKTSQKQKDVPSVSHNVAKCDKDDDVPAFFQFITEEFPGFKFPESTQSLLIKHYYHHVSQIHKQLKNTYLKKPTTFIQTEEAMEKEAKLSKILVKDLNEKKYLRELNERRSVETRIKSGFRDARLRSAKTRQYFDEFHLSMRKKMQKRNYSEEALVESTFKEILDQQKEKVRQLCQRVRETDAQDAVQHRHYLDSLKNLYRHQLDMLTESVNADMRASSEREKAQASAMRKMNQEFRKELQKEVRSLQEDVVKMIEDIHFRELDAQNFIRSFKA